MSSEEDVYKKKLELLRLSKSEIIKKCKKQNIAINGSKNDMVDRLIKNSKRNTNIKKKKKIIKNKKGPLHKKEKVNDKQIEKDDEKDDDYKIRKSWKVGGFVEIFSITKKKWFQGKIFKISNNNQGETLQITYYNDTRIIRKEINRYSKDMRPTEEDKKAINIPPLPMWIQQQSLSKQMASSFIFVFNGHTIMCLDKSYDNIYEYLMDENKWKLYQNIQHKLNYKPNAITSIYFDNKSNYLYIKSINKGIQFIDFNEKVLKLNPTYIINKSDDNKIESLDKLIMINDQCHYFKEARGSTLNHFIFNRKTNKLDDEILIKVDDHDWLENFGLVYVPNKGELLIIGGSGSWAISQKVIWYFSLKKKTKKWKHYKNELPVSMSLPCCILTEDEKYVIILGGETHVGGFAMGATMGIDNICVLNLETSEIKQCKINCPLKGENIAFIPLKTSSFKVNLLIYRFVHIYIKQIASDDIITVIKSFYGGLNEYIHLFNSQKDTVSHWKIATNDIINSCS